MSSVNFTNATWKSNYPSAPDGIVQTEAVLKHHPLVTGPAAGLPAKSPVDVGGVDTNLDGVGTRSDRKIV